jgi:hypothetical protein
LSANIFHIVTRYCNNVLSSVYLIEFAAVFQLLCSLWAGYKLFIFTSNLDTVNKDVCVGADMLGRSRFFVQAAGDTNCLFIYI